MLKVINLEASFARFEETFTPKIVAELNGQYVMLVHCEGDRVPWHIHEAEDEMFFVIDGRLEVFTRDDSVTLSAGEFCVVPQGVEHRVVPHDHVRLMLFEPSGTAHTGTVQAEITRDRHEWLE